MKYKGEIEGFPTEVVEKMLERQVEQGNKRDVSVFENYSASNRRNGGFDWDEAAATHEEEFDFWDKVIFEKRFDVFFDKYPKAKEEPQPESESKYSQAEIAAMAMQGILSNIGMAFDPDQVAQKSIAYANALIERLKAG